LVVPTSRSLQPARHDVGHAEGTADLDQLAARDDHLAPGRQRGQHQQDGGGVVVDDVAASAPVSWHSSFSTWLSRSPRAGRSSGRIRG
jgi:hypothetical protein